MYLPHLLPPGKRIVVAEYRDAPQPGEVVSFRVVPASTSSQAVVELDNRLWRLATEADTAFEPAPRLPRITKKK